MAKLTKRKGFNFFRSYFDVYNELETIEDKVMFIDALLDRQFMGIKPTNLKGMAKFAYISQTNSIDSQVKGYEDKTGDILTPCQGGAVGGKTPPAIQVEVKEKVEVEVEEKVEVKVKNTPNGVVDFANQLPVHKIDFDKLLSFFNSNRGLLPEVKKMSDVRKKRIQLLEKQYGKESIQVVIQKTRDSPFLQGDNKENWTASFDWIFKPANFLKILEDNYGNRENIRNINLQRSDADLKKSSVNAVNAMFGIK